MGAYQSTCLNSVECSTHRVAEVEDMPNAKLLDRLTAAGLNFAQVATAKHLVAQKICEEAGKAQV